MCLEAEHAMKYQCEWKHRYVKQEMVTYITKGRQSLSFLFSEVVQRYSDDEEVMCWLAPLTMDDLRLELFLHFTANRNGSDYACPFVAIFNPFIFVFDLNFFLLNLNFVSKIDLNLKQIPI